jgi:hypothetical protein
LQLYDCVILGDYTPFGGNQPSHPNSSEAGGESFLEIGYTRDCRSLR